MNILPMPGYLVLEAVDLEQKSGSGLILQTKVTALQIVASASNKFSVGNHVVLGGNEKLTKVETLGKTLLVASEASVIATIEP